MDSSLLPWKILVYRDFMRALKSLRSCLRRAEGCPLAFYTSLFSFSSCWMRCWQALCLSDSISLIFFSIFSSLSPQKLRLILQRIDYITIHMKRESWGSSMIDSPSRNKVEPRRNTSYRSSSRKPIFDAPYRTNTKPLALRSMPNSSQSFHIQFQSISSDDFCGCEHNLEPCPIVRQLLKGVSESEMRRQYERLETLGGKKSRIQLRRKYFRLLPSYYPEIFHAHLANLIANVEEELTSGQFLLLASLQYHAKYQHITFFLFEDLRKAQKGKKMFLAQLQTALIAHQVDYISLLQSSRKQGVALQAFLESYRETFGACIIPLSQYAKFIKLLLSKGYKSLRNLLIILLSSFQQSLFDLLQSYSNPNVFRQKSRALFWQKYFQRLTEA